MTTIPDLADWVRNVGGERVKVSSLLNGAENPHNYEPSPEDARLLGEADLLVEVGLGLEEWLHGLVENAGNKKLRVMTVAEQTMPNEVRSEKPEAKSQSEGVQSPTSNVHSHSSRNPHVWLDPENATAACARIAEELGRLDSAGAEAFRANAERYSQRLDSLTVVLTTLAQTLPDRRFISYHETWPYFARRFGFDVVAAIEPLPGQEPSAKYLAGLVKLVKDKGVRVICTEPQLPGDVPEALAREAGVKLITLAPITGALPQAGTYFKLLDYNVRTLAAALKP